MIKKHIYLTGFMGAGKSKIGPILAENLGCSFFDSDHLIEKESGKRIFDIFEKEGEAAFRNMESNMIRRLANKSDPAVISLGGGALKRQQNLELIRQTGIRVYIKSSPESIVERVKHSTKRPLLRIEDGPDYEQRLLERIHALLGQRKALYEQAEIILDRDALELGTIVEELTRQIKTLEEFSDEAN